LKEKIMKTLSTMAAGAVVLLSLAGPTLAASRSHAVASDVNTVKTYGDQDPNNPPYRSGFSPYGRSPSSYQDNTGHPYQSYGPGQNLPYPDRPYGDPDVD
jgi:hypothetical protein